MKKLLLLLTPFLFWGAAHAKDIYVAQSTQGSNSGADATNAHSAAWFNTSTNWGNGAGNISAGDTVHLCGTLTSELTAQAGGSSGNVITILFETGAQMSKAYWNTTALTLNNSYITVDGGTNGLIECTANGTGLANQRDCKGIYVNSASNVTIRNLTIRNIYVRTAGTELNGFGAGIFFDASMSSISNILAENCKISHASNGIVSNFGSNSSNYVFRNNTVSYCNWSINAGDRGSKTDSLTGLVISGNTVSQWSNWNETSANSFHHNGVFIYANQGTCTGPIVSGNFFGAGLGGSYQTSYIYENTGIINPIVCNNIFAPGNNEGSGNGAVVVSSTLATTIRIVNNTFVQIGTGGPGIQTTGFPPGQTLIIQNNIFSGNWYYNISLYSTSNLTTILNHNLYFNAPHFSVGAGFETYATWKSYGYDTDAILTDPKLDSSYHLMTGSPAIGAGTSFLSLNIPLLTADKDGNARSSWDLGAYKSGGVSPTLPPSNAVININTGP